MKRMEFTTTTQLAALHRQKFYCASCGTRITRLGELGRSQHKYHEIAHAHHVLHAKLGGTSSVDNCVILCQSCHYSVHEGGNYRFGIVISRAEDYSFFRGKK